MLTNNRPGFARATLRFGGYLLAIGLLAASVWYAIQGQRVEDWWILLGAEPWLTTGFFAMVAMSAVFVPGIQFWLVTRPFVSGPPLSLVSMTALAAGGGLLNYTPFKAGMIGRIAYLKHIHGVGYRAALLTHAVLVVAFVSISVLTILITIWRGSFDMVWWLSSLTGLVILAGFSVPMLRATMPADMLVDARLRDSTGRLITYLGLCYAVQFLSLYCTAVRWWLVFRILDRPIGLADAWVAAVIHIVTVMAGPANGVGLREWLIGIGGQLGGVSSGLEMSLRVSMSAALIDRGVEAAVLIALGLLGLAFLRYGHRRSGNGRADRASDSK